MPAFETVAAALLTAAGLAGLGLAAFQLRRRMGHLPLLAMVALIAVIPAATLHLFLDGRTTQAGAVSPVLAVVPALVSLGLFVYGTLGWRTGIQVACLPLAAGVAIGVLSLASAFVATPVPEAWLPTRARLPLVAGLVAMLGVTAAYGIYHGLHRIGIGILPGVPLGVAAMVGTGVHGTALVGLDEALGLGLGTDLLVSAAGPAVLALVPAGLLALSLEIHLAGLDPDLRTEMLSREPSGRQSLSDTYANAQARELAQAEAVRKQASSYVDLLEGLPEGAYLCKPNGRITYANPALARLLGRPGERLAGKNVAHLLATTQDGGRPRFARYAVEEGKHRAAVTLPNGRMRMVEVTVRSNRSGKLQGRVRDLTEDHLRLQLERQKERAEFYVDLLRHDIGNHIGMPLLHLEILADDDGIGEDQRERVRSAYTGVNEIAELLERVDVLSQIDEVEPEPMDLAPLITSVAGSFAQRHPQATVTTDLPGQPIRVHGSMLLRDALVNLVGNALRHAGPEATITLGAQRRGDRWVVRVDDDGPGIPDDLKETVFQRAEKDQGSSGKGLGLYIVHTVARSLGAKAWATDRVDGEPGAGASFRLALKAAGTGTEHQADLAAAAEAAEEQGSGRAKA